MKTRILALIVLLTLALSSCRTTKPEVQTDSASVRIEWRDRDKIVYVSDTLRERVEVFVKGDTLREKITQYKTKRIEIHDTLIVIQHDTIRTSRREYIKVQPTTREKLKLIFTGAVLVLAIGLIVYARRKVIALRKAM